MNPPAPGDGPGRRYFAIAHRAGNNLHDLEAALEAGVDAIECDLWHDRGRLALRHERKLPGIPVIYDKWYLRWSWGELRLRDLLREIDFRAQLFLDIKSRTPRAAEAVLELYHDHESMLPMTIVSSPQWRLLDTLGAAGTAMRMFYSIGRRGGIDGLLLRAESEHPPAGASVRHTLLSAATVARLHEGGMQVYAWTVNTAARAEELLSWGVDGIISDDIDVLCHLD